MSYLSHTDEDRADLLAAIGVSSLEELFSPIPPGLRVAGLDLGTGLSEPEVRAALQALAARNRPLGPTSFLGGGAYHHAIPAAVRSLVGRTEFATSYTPYQAEVSQGTLQTIFEFQTAICELTGLDIANASLYDGASAAAEAAFLGLREMGRERIVLSGGIHPETEQVIRTYAHGPGFEVALTPLGDDGRTQTPATDTLTAAGVLVAQQPNHFGVIEDIGPLAEAAHAAGALLVVSQNPITLGVLASPGALGADIAVGDLQVLGNDAAFGGPSAGYLAARAAFVRQLPGRLVGRTTDMDGRVSYALTLQAREQHIRRAKATSNICSNQALNALAATITLALLGPTGLRELGELCLQRAHHLQAGLVSFAGVEPLFPGPFFHEFAVRLPMPAAEFRSALRSRGVDPGIPLDRFRPNLTDALLVAVTESNTPAALDRYLEAAGAVLAGRQEA